MPDPAVVVAMREFKQGLLAREAVQMQAMAKQWLTVENALDKRIVELAEDIATRKERGEVVTESRLYRLQRYQELMAQTQAEFTKYAAWAGKDISRYQEGNGILGLQHASTAIQLSYLPGGVGVSFNRLPREAVENIVGIAADGKPLNELLKLRMVRDEHGSPLPGVLDRLTSSLITGTALGRNPRVVARDMRDDLSGGLSKALLIARTEGLRPYREMARAQYEASGVVSGHRRLSAHDGRVCPACLADEGTLYRTNETMSDHPNGRCTSVPVVEGMPEVDWLKGEDWLRTQPEGVQRSILGSARFELWQNGAFQFKQLVQKHYSTVWGESLTPAPASALGTLRQRQAVATLSQAAPIPPDLIPAGWIEIIDAADRLGLSYQYTLKLVNAGTIEGRKIEVNGRGRWIVSVASIDAYLVSRGKKPPKPPPTAERWLTVSEAADYAGLSTARIRGLIKEGRLDSKTDLRNNRNVIVVSQSSLDAYMAETGRKPPQIVPQGYATKEVIAERLAGRGVTPAVINEVTEVLLAYNVTSQKVQLPNGPMVTVYNIAEAEAAWKDHAGGKIPNKIPPGYAEIRDIAAKLGTAEALLWEFIDTGTTLKPLDVLLPGSRKPVRVYNVADVTAEYRAIMGGDGRPPGYYTSQELADKLGEKIGIIYVVLRKYNVASVIVKQSGKKHLVVYPLADVMAALKDYHGEGKIPKGYYTPPGIAARLGIDEKTVLTIVVKYGLEAVHAVIDGRPGVFYSLAEVKGAWEVEGGGGPAVGEKWLTVSEAADVIGLSTARVRGLINEGKLTSEKRKNPSTGRTQIMVSQSSIDAYLGVSGKKPPATVTPTKPTKVVKPTGKVPPKTGTAGFLTPEDIDARNGWPPGTSRMLMQKYNITGRFHSRTHKIVLWPDDVKYFADLEGVKPARSIEERRKEVAELRKQMFEEYPDEPRWSEIDTIREKYIYLPEDQQTQWSGKYTGITSRTNLYKETERGLTEVGRMVGRRSVMPTGHTVSVQKVRKASEARSYHIENRGIFLSKQAYVKTVIHELGHELEEADAQVHREAMDFLRRRTKGERLEWLGPGYGRDEKSRKDKFIRPYMGKDYGADATEIISMGLEYIWRDPWEFAEKDPDMFDFILAVVRE